MNEKIITARHINKLYRRGSEDIYALKNVNLDIDKGDFVVVLGPSGSGKTTLLNLLGCLDKPTSGTLFVNHINVSELGENELVKIRRENIGFVFQQFYLLPTLNVYENIELPLLFRKKPIYQNKVEKTIEAVGLKNRACHLPHQLSGGEMQRVAIGRALINEPKIILADEPTGNLDSNTADKIMELLCSLNRHGLTLIIVTHNAELARFANTTINLKDGEIVSISINPKEGRDGEGISENQVQVH